MEKATRDFLEEVEAAEKKAAALSAEIVEETGSIDARARTWSRSLIAVEAIETDPAILAHMEQLQQTLRALQREVGEMESALRKVVRTEKQFFRIIGQLRPSEDA